jgi:hypothetical protein
MVEGPGVNAENRMTDLLEASTGDEHLNFGTSGGFGSLQEWLLYRDLASKFDHSAVYVFFLPDNDFEDNRSDSKKSADDPANPARYRPYLRVTDSGYEVAYNVRFENRPHHGEMPWSERMINHVYNHVCVLNAIKQIDLRSRKRMRTAGYDDFDDKDARLLLYTYDQIVKLAAPRPVTFFIVPRHRDFMAHDSGTLKRRAVALLNEFAAEHPGVHVYDLMPAFLDYAKQHHVSWTACYLPNDGHWNTLGHRVAAEAILAYTKDQK